MKKYLFLSIVLVSVILPWACSDNNNNPTKPPAVSGGSGPTNTPTSAIFGTSTPTVGAGTITATPTVTATFQTAPVYKTQFKTASNPTGFCLSALAGGLLVSEGTAGEYPCLELYNQASGTLINQTNFLIVVLTGSPVTALFNNLLGAGVNSATGYYTVLDGPLATGGPSTVYTGSSWGICDIADGSTYGNGSLTNPGKAFSNPQGFAVDTNTYYVADTGNQQVDQFNPNNCGPYICPIHWWGGGPSNTFIAPSALTTDPSGDVFIGDPNYNPSLIQEFKSSGLQGGVTYVGSFFATTNCVVSGMAIDPAAPTHLYVSDTKNKKVEEYDITNIGSNSALLMRAWGDPQGPYEFAPFGPSCIAIDDVNGNILVGDSNNRLVNVFNGL